MQRGEEINTLLKGSLYAFTDNWGVDMINVQIKNIDTIDIDEDLLKPPKAQFQNKETVINAAGAGEAEKIKREFIGIGEAEATKLMLFAKGVGYQQIAEQLNMNSGDVLIKLDLISKVLEGANLTFVGVEMNEIFKIITAVKNFDIQK